MSLKLSLAVCSGLSIVESHVLSKSKKCFESILPKRDPDRSEGEKKAWTISFDRRRVFGLYANDMLETFNAQNLYKHSAEELAGFFTLAGVESRWLDNNYVDWCLILE
jgi:hypothetical protein